MKDIEPIKQAYFVNQMARAVFSLPTNVMRVVAYLLAVVDRDDPKTWKLRVTEQDMREALQYAKGGKTTALVEGAFDQTQSHILKVPIGEKTKSGRDRWKKYNWLTATELVDDGVYELGLNEALMKEVILNPKYGWRMNPLPVYGKLQGRYSLQWYNLLMSMAGKEGQGGNPKLTWYYDITPDEVREQFMVTAYPRMNSFRANVVDAPIREINEKNIGLHVTVNPEYKRRQLVNFHLTIKRIPQDEPRPVHPATESEDEEDRIINSDPVRYRELVNEFLKQGSLLDDETDHLAYASREAIKVLKQNMKKGSKKRKKN